MRSRWKGVFRIKKMLAFIFMKNGLNIYIVMWKSNLKREPSGSLFCVTIWTSHEVMKESLFFALQSEHLRSDEREHKKNDWQLGCFLLNVILIALLIFKTCSKNLKSAPQREFETQQTSLLTLFFLAPKNALI